MEDLSGMTIDELATLLSNLRTELEDLEEERMFVLGQTGLHVSAGAVNRYETDVNDLKTRIMEVHQALNAKRAE